ncbi:hypothetical protein NPIL_567671 [Nephila pilipes]|uniref:Uncharacterized protein n=1 Tax=Nephila pilipes TaxID=299642 RepID=A0A8X6NN47_NEPPI|nr:hypothetical protein NPIL_567671 [Nephila pilipes]
MGDGAGKGRPGDAEWKECWSEKKSWLERENVIAKIPIPITSAGNAMEITFALIERLCLSCLLTPYAYDLTRAKNLAEESIQERHITISK